MTEMLTRPKHGENENANNLMRTITRPKINFENKNETNNHKNENENSGRKKLTYNI